jgi:signal transduction histidine kinase
MAAGTTRFQRAVRLMLPDESVRWLLSRGEISLDPAGKPVLVHGAAIDITEQKRTEAALRESMVRQDYLVRLGDALRPLADPISIQNIAARLLAEQLGASRTYYYEYDEDTRIGTVQQAYVRSGEHAIVGTYRLDDFPLAHAVLHANQPLIFADAHSAPDLSAAERDQYTTLDIRAIICVPLVKHGKLVAVCVVTQSTPRTWTPLELSLVTETAERTWAAVERAHAEAALQQSEARLRSVFESIDEGFCIAEMIFDANDRPIDYRFLQANPLFEQQTGLAGAVGRTARELVPDLEEWWFETYGRVALTGEAVRFEHESVPMGRWFDVYASRVGGPASRQVAIVFNNITARKAAEAQVHAALAAEQAARMAAEAASTRTMRLQAVTAALAGALSREAVIQVITDHGVAATGASVAVVGLLDAAGEQLEVVGWGGPYLAANPDRRPLPFDAPLPQTTAVRTGEPVWLYSRTDAATRFPGFETIMARFGDHAVAALPLLSADRVLGSLTFGFPMPHSFAPEDRSFLIILAQQCAQALERARLYSEVLVGQERLQHLSQRLIQAQEQERRHLARELHDEVGQALTGLRLALELAERLPAEQRAERLADAHRATQDLIAKIRVLSLDLRPAMLDDMGLLPALLWQLKRYREQTGISVELRHWGLDQRLPSTVETVAYRVIQEALTNIARHAGVPTATVTLLASDGQLLVQIRDAGRGFVLSDVLANNASSGLVGMQERVALLGGTLSIETEPGQGVCITADLPLREER